MKIFNRSFPEIKNYDFFQYAYWTGFLLANLILKDYLETQEEHFIQLQDYYFSKILRNPECTRILLCNL